MILGAAQGGGEAQFTEDFGLFAKDAIPAAMTRLHLLSVSEWVTTIVALVLAESGDLRPDEIFPGVPPDDADLTLHQSLTHSAGFSGLSVDDFEPV